MIGFLKIGWRNLWRNTRRSLAVISAGGVGVAAIILSVGVTRGIIRQIINSNLSFETGHIQIHRKGFFKNPSVNLAFVPERKLLSMLEKLPSVKAFAPRINVTGLIMTAENSAGVIITGIQPGMEKNVSSIEKSVRTGNFLSDEESGKILIGKKLARKLGVSPGDKVVLMAQGAGQEVGAMSFRIGGIYRARLAAYEKIYVFITIEDARKLLKLPEGAITGFTIITTNPEKADTIAETLRKMIGDETLEILSWKKLQPILQEIITFYSMAIYFVYILIFVGITFAVLNTVLMVVFERTREFGILSAIGMKPHEIVLMVLSECFWLGLLSAGGGSALGVALLYYLHTHGINLSSLAGGAEFWGIGHIIYPDFSVASIFQGAIYTLFLIMIVSLYPSIKAGRMKPVDALRFH